MAKGVNKNKIILINAIVIIFAAAFAIIIHAALPAPVDALDFDSLPVKLFGFPVVAVSYFLLLFIHCAIAIQYFGRQSNLPKLEAGYRFGMAFAILYLFGMQEVVVEASPFEAWGFDYVIYQFFMGLGDAIPVLLLCITLAYFTLAQRKSPAPVRTLSKRGKTLIVASFTLTFFIQRTIGYTTGLVDSNLGNYPVQTYLWTALFGAILGCAYIVLYPAFAKEQNTLSLSVQLSLLTIGANWIIFNSFIGLIFSGAMPQMLFRSGLDTVVLFLTSLAITRYLRNQAFYKK